MSADLEMARKMVANAKPPVLRYAMRRNPFWFIGGIAPAFLPDVFAALKEKGVRLLDAGIQKIWEISAAAEEDYAKRTSGSGHVG